MNTAYKNLNFLRKLFFLVAFKHQLIYFKQDFISKFSK